MRLGEVVKSGTTKNPLKFNNWKISKTPPHVPTFLLSTYEQSKGPKRFLLYPATDNYFGLVTVLCDYLKVRSLEAIPYSMTAKDGQPLKLAWLTTS